MLEWCARGLCGLGAAACTLRGRARGMPVATGVGCSGCGRLPWQELLPKEGAGAYQ